MPADSPIMREHWSDRDRSPRLVAGNIKNFVPRSKGEAMNVAKVVLLRSLVRPFLRWLEMVQMAGQAQSLRRDSKPSMKPQS